MFPPNGLVLIRGRDVETGESSGTGKSAIFLGLAQVLDILPSEFSAKALQNWDEDAGQLQLTLTLVDGDKTVELKRGKETKVTFADGTVSNGAKSYSEALYKVFGLAPEILQALTYRAQGKNSFFLSMDPAELVKFLTRVLNLESLEEAVLAANAKISELDPKVEAARQTVSALETAYKNAEAEPVPPPLADDIGVAELKLNEYDLPAAAKAKATLQNARTALEELEAVAANATSGQLQVKRNELTQAQSFLKQAQSAQAKTNADYRESEQRIRGQIRQLDASLNKVVIAEAELAGCKSQLESLQADECPTCEREWSNPKSQVFRKKFAERIVVLETEVRGRGIYESQRKQLEVELQKTLEPPQDPRLEKLREIEQKLQREFLLLQPDGPSPQVKAATEEVRKAEAQLVEANRQVEVTKGLLREQRLRIQGRDALVQARERRLETIKKQLDGALIGLTDLTINLNAERDFVAMMGREGFLGIIFEEVLQEIAQETNRRLGRLANTAEVRVDFQTESDKGKRQIKTWVEVRGHRGKLDAACSGGMQTSVAQIIDLAVVTVIGRRSGGTLPGWMCLDEVTNGQGAVTKESALEIMREIAEERLVLVIDHGTELKEAFTQTIDIEFKNGVSSLA